MLRNCVQPQQTTLPSRLSAQSYRYPAASLTGSISRGIWAHRRGVRKQVTRPTVLTIGPSGGVGSPGALSTQLWLCDEAMSTALMPSGGDARPMHCWAELQPVSQLVSQSWVEPQHLMSSDGRITQ